MRKLVLSFAAFISLSFCLSVQAAHYESRGAKNAGSAGGATNAQLTRTLGGFVIAGGVIWGVEEGGKLIGLDQSVLKAAELVTVLSTAGWTLQKQELVEASAKVPLILATQKFATSKAFQELLTKMPLFGDSLKNMGDDLKPLASMAMYNLVTLQGYDLARANWIDPYLNIPRQRD